MFNKILIANRGEIACRIIRTCRRLGTKSVAIYSDADVQAPHVKLADEAYHVGPPRAAQSYLNIEKIISVAKACGAEAIHPGYGFLSENPAFAEKVAEAGLVFIGPSAEALLAIGNKASARQLLEGSGVPFIPRAEVPLDEPGKAAEIADKFGYPLVVKPSNAGGGKGTSIVPTQDRLDEAVEYASGVASRSFGTAAVHIERYLENVRHIEIQTVADSLGNTIHLMERECSWQRRYQKIVEESPSMVVSPLLRQKLAATAVTVMKEARYVNVGTVEFLVDSHNAFYFLEANCRIQVEHPVTELITRLDMVELQLNIALGQRLALPQEKVLARGHAIEARIYAEDPDTFLPSAGLITSYREPLSPGIRVDSGVCKGYEVTPDYDPMLAKLIVWGETREEATDIMIEALQDFVIEGLQTNIPLLSKVFSHPAFISGDYNTTILTPEFIKAPVASRRGRGLSEYWRYGY